MSFTFGMLSLKSNRLEVLDFLNGDRGDPGFLIDLGDRGNPRFFLLDNEDPRSIFGEPGFRRT